MKQQPRGGALANGSISNNVEDQSSINNNISDQSNATKDESPIRQISFASHTPLNQSIASRDDEDEDEGERANNAFYRRADKNLSKLLTPEEHSCRVQ